MSLRPLGVALACAAWSCSYVDGTSTPYVGVPRFERVDPAKVQVLAGEPAQRHDRLGEVLLRMSIDPAPAVEDIEIELRERAGAMGGNAVYVARDQVVPGYERALVGIVIRYRQ